MSTALRVIIGAGEQRWDGWIPTQQHELDLLDPNSFSGWFGGRSADALLCEHVWEHLTIDEGTAAAKLCAQYLRPGGRLRIAVPDGRFPDDEYQRTVQVGGPGPRDHPAADHRVVFVHETLTAMFVAAGYCVHLLEWWDADGTFWVEPWSIDDGPIYRSSRMDHRNIDYRTGIGRPGFTSLILDAFVPT